MNLFAEQIEQQAIERIQKFAKIAKAMGFEVCLGFSGGKDSQVCYDLCKRSGIDFKAYYNVALKVLLQSGLFVSIIQMSFGARTTSLASSKIFGEITVDCCLL